MAFSEEEEEERILCTRKVILPDCSVPLLNVKTAATHLFVGLTCGLVALVFSLLPPGEFIELKGYDLLHSLRGQAPAPREIIVVAIDEPSFAELNLQWPWPRSLHGRLIDSLKEAGASVIGFDIVFAEPSSPDEDRSFADAIRRAGNVVLASDIEVVAHGNYTQEMSIEPLSLFTNGPLTGVVTIPVDRDNVVRRFYPVKSEERLFAEQVAFVHSKMARRVPKGAAIAYAGPSGFFPAVSYYQALEPAKFLPPDFLRGKVVLVGKAVKSGIEPERSSPDIFATPFLFSGRKGLMYGVEIQANMTGDLLRERFVMKMSTFSAAVLFFLAGLLGSFLQIGWRPIKSGLLTLLCTTGCLAIAYYSLERLNLWIPVFLISLPVLAPYGIWGAEAYVRSERRRREIRKAFSHYLSPSVLESVLANPENLKLGGKRVEATVLFSDIADFTTIAEKMPPEEVANLLNRYFAEMTKIIFRYKGTMDKFIGDAVMAFWGAPVNDADHAMNACRAAVAMQERLEVLRGEMKEAGLPEIEVRVGINTGMVIAGNMGSAELFDYTVLGDAVNLASRLEGANKQFGTRILISGPVHEEVSARVEDRPLGAIKVKGKTEEVEVYELVRVCDDAW